MKKILTFVLCVVLIITLASTMFADESSQNIAGLEEKMDALWLNNNFTQQQIEEMNQQYIEWFNAAWPGELIGLNAVGSRKYRYDDDAEYAYRFEQAQLNFNDGVFVNTITTNTYRYINQYANDGIFSYLFLGQRCWFVPSLNGSSTRRLLLEDGMVMDRFNTSNANTSIAITSDMIGFLKDTNTIRELLLEKKEAVVTDVRLFGFGNTRTLLYFECGTNEYIILLTKNDDMGRQRIEGIDPFVLYTAKELIQALEDQRVESSNGSYTTDTKPTFDLEAEALQSSGLLHGNEKGLDLLKPLTRIEATTLLVRALGLERETISTNSQFSDIPNDHWGAKYANIAASHGITQGVGDNKFAPDTLVTDNQFATFVLRAAETGDFDWQQAINILIEREIITEDDTATMDLFTRGDMAKIIYEAREKGFL